jgi:Cu(I)/Ag(I) efflux system membrane fusion protein
MTSSSIDKLLLCLLIAVAVACNERVDHNHTASLHTTDSALAAEIKRINGSHESNIETIVADNATKIFSVELDGVVAYDSRNRQSISARVDGRIEKLFVRYNRQQVTKGQKIMEIYSPQLASAQREMIYLSKSGQRDLLAKARTRVRLLGLTEQQIDNIIATGEVKYSLPVYSLTSGYIVEGGGDSMSTSANSSFSISEGQYVMAGQTIFNVYNSDKLVAEFSITPDLAPYIRQADNLLFFPTYDNSQMKQARIGLIEPVLRSGEQFSVARVYLGNTNLKVGDVLDARVPIKLKGWWLPATSIWTQGTGAVVYRKVGDVFKPQQVNVRTIINGQALIDNKVADWVVAKNASFFRDSDSFVNTKTADE